jgi:hypothetical protein
MIRHQKNILVSHSASTPLRFGMLGMNPGNGHPYSWSAIINGFDAQAMAACPYQGIPRYLGAQPAGSVKVEQASVTHVWTDNPAEASAVSKAAYIPHIVSRPEDVIGQVDAVFIAVDDGFDHAQRARPFIEAGIPVFVDKPLATSITDLKAFIDWSVQGARFLSSSGMRYAPELDHLTSGQANSLGKWRWISGVSCKTWERYAIHILEPAFRLLGSGFESVRLESRPGIEIAHIIHASGIQLSLPVIYDGAASFGSLQISGTNGHLALKMTDTYTAFRRQIVSFVDYVRSGVLPFPFAETVELMAVIIAGLWSREQQSRRVTVSEIYSALSWCPPGAIPKNTLT